MARQAHMARALLGEDPYRLPRLRSCNLPKHKPQFSFLADVASECVCTGDLGRECVGTRLRSSQHRDGSPFGREPPCQCRSVAWTNARDNRHLLLSHRRVLPIVRLDRRPGRVAQNSGGLAFKDGRPKGVMMTASSQITGPLTVGRLSWMIPDVI